MRRRSYLADTSGAAAVEFALAVLPLMLTIVATIQLARYAWAVQSVQAVATAVARCVGLRHANCAVAATPSQNLTQSYAVATAAGWHITLLPAQVTVAGTATCGGTSGMSQVTIAYTFNAFSALVPALSSVPVSATACFPNAS